MDVTDECCENKGFLLHDIFRFATFFEESTGFLLWLCYNIG